jgi:hypothetical protein
MKARMAVVALLTLAISSQAQAGIFSHKTKLPKAEAPIVDRGGQDDRKVGFKKHSHKYNDIAWGANWNRWLTVNTTFQASHWAEF